MQMIYAVVNWRQKVFVFLRIKIISYTLPFSSNSAKHPVQAIELRFQNASFSDNNFLTQFASFRMEDK